MADSNPDQFDITKDSEMNKAAPISFGEKLESLEDHISHAPLDLGGGSVPAAVPAKPRNPISASAKRQAVPEQNTFMAAPMVQQPRITGIKVFFTKLHAGALDFLSEQVTEWLKANPNINIKQTNTVVGEISAKNTEPNLIITVWY